MVVIVFRVREVYLGVVSVSSISFICGFFFTEDQGALRIVDRKSFSVWL